jgi:hypothetical protein
MHPEVLMIDWLVKGKLDPVRAEYKLLDALLVQVLS